MLLIMFFQLFPKFVPKSQCCILLWCIDTDLDQISRKILGCENRNNLLVDTSGRFNDERQLKVDKEIIEEKELVMEGNDVHGLLLNSNDVKNKESTCLQLYFSKIDLYNTFKHHFELR